MKKNLFLFALVLSLSLFLAACGGAGSSADTSIKVDMVEFMFTPDTYTVPAGQEITIELKNSGAIEHEFVIMKFGTEVSQPFDDDDEPNIYWEHEVPAGQTETVTFTAPTEPGTYQVVCGIAGHMEAGMVGKLIVVAP
ncbi:MAG: cupredoxin domain-containing protein [Anaerolineales bacterium]